MRPAAEHRVEHKRVQAAGAISLPRERKGPVEPARRREAPRGCGVRARVRAAARERRVAEVHD
jgi:hypothetical protein